MMNFKIYPLYKAAPPYQIVDKDIGHGYYGVLLYNEDLDLVQCHVCGKWVKNITSSHCNRVHSMTDEQYRDRYGFTNRLALCSKGTSLKHSSQYIKNFNGINALKKHGFGKNKEKVKSPDYITKLRKSYTKASFKNAHNICDEQLKHRINVVCFQIGHRNPSEREICEYDKGLVSALYRRHGTFGKAKKILGLGTKKCGPEPLTEEKLIAEIRDWTMKNKRIPKAKEFIKYQTCCRVFGSWKKALMSSGVHGILHEGATM